MDEKIKTWTLRFSAKENPNMEKAMDKALFDWPIVLQYRTFSGLKFFLPERSLKQPAPTVCDGLAESLLSYTIRQHR